MVNRERKKCHILRGSRMMFFLSLLSRTAKNISKFAYQALWAFSVYLDFVLHLYRCLIIRFSCVCSWYPSFYSFTGSYFKRCWILFMVDVNSSHEWKTATTRRLVDKCFVPDNMVLLQHQSEKHFSGFLNNVLRLKNIFHMMLKASEINAFCLESIHFFSSLTDMLTAIWLRLTEVSTLKTKVWLLTGHYHNRYFFPCFRCY